MFDTGKFRVRYRNDAHIWQRKNRSITVISVGYMRIQVFINVIIHIILFYYSLDENTVLFKPMLE